MEKNISMWINVKKNRKITIVKEEYLCALPQPIKQKIFILEEH